MTEGRAADCQEASRVIAGLSAGHFLADRGYDDTNAILAQASAQGMMSVIATKKNRKVQRLYDKK